MSITIKMKELDEPCSWIKDLVHVPPPLLLQWHRPEVVIVNIRVPRRDDAPTLTSRVLQHGLQLEIGRVHGQEGGGEDGEDKYFEQHFPNMIFGTSFFALY